MPECAVPLRSVVNCVFVHATVAVLGTTETGTCPVLLNAHRRVQRRRRLAMETSRYLVRGRARRPCVVAVSFHASGGFLGPATFRVMWTTDSESVDDERRDGRNERTMARERRGRKRVRAPFIARDELRDRGGRRTPRASCVVTTANECTPGTLHVTRVITRGCLLTSTFASHNSCNRAPRPSKRTNENRDVATTSARASSGDGDEKEFKGTRGELVDSTATPRWDDSNRLTRDDERMLFGKRTRSTQSGGRGAGVRRATPAARSIPARFPVPARERVIFYLYSRKCFRNFQSS